MKLIIAEKKELAEAIAAIFPNRKATKGFRIEAGEYNITWLKGHILTHKQPEEMDEKYKKWSLEGLPIYFPNWGKKVIEEKKTQFLEVERLISESSEIIHAGDTDDEGQYLVDEVLEYCRYKKTVKRLLVNDNSLGGVKKAFTSMEDNTKFVPLGKAAEARSLSDMIVGFNLSRYFTLVHGGSTLTVGRVQTPLLALVVNRDEQIANHIKEMYFDLYATVVGGEEIVCKRTSKAILSSLVDVEELTTRLCSKPITVVVETKRGTTAPPLPYELGKLSEEANKKFKYSSKKVMEITQSLRDIHHAITYNRSDCPYLSEEHWKEAPSLVPSVLSRLGDVGSLSISYALEGRSKCFQEDKIKAHHGIIPTEEGDPSKMSEEERNIWLMIARRYLLQFLPKEEFEKTEVRFEAQEETFVTSSKKVLSDGFYSFVGREKKATEEIEDKGWGNLKNGSYPQSLSKSSFREEEKETKPKKPYTEGTLGKDMRSIYKYVKSKEIRDILKKRDGQGAIGTAATQAPILESLFKRGYLQRKGNQVLSTQLAREYLKTLPLELKEADMTALWWVAQEEIKEGKKNKDSLPLSVLEDVKRIMKEYNVPKGVIFSQSSGGTRCSCPICGNEVALSQKGTSYYCKGYKSGCEFKLVQEQSVFGKKVKLTEAHIKSLLSNKEILLKGLPSKKGGTYDAYFVLEVKNGWGNLSLSRFPKKK